MKSTLTLLTLCGLLAAGCADKLPIDPTDQPVTPTGERLVVSYVVDIGSSGKYRVASGLADGSSFTRILDALVVTPPHAGRLIFAGLGFSSVGTIVVANLDGKNQTSVGATPVGSSLEWFSPTVSPDGSKVAYVIDHRDQTGGSNDTSRLYVADITGLNRVTVDSNIANETPVAFSHDGKYIAYFTGDYASAKDGKLMVRDVKAQSAPQVLAENLDLINDGYTGIDWAPDGTKILFNRNATTEEPELVEVTVSTGQARVLAIGGLGRYSADGTKIAFVGGGVADIVVIPTGGGATTNLTNTTGTFELYPSWSSDGRHIVCAAHDGTPDDTPGRLRLIDVATGTFQDRTITDPEGTVSVYRGYFAR